MTTETKTRKSTSIRKKATPASMPVEVARDAGVIESAAEQIEPPAEGSSELVTLPEEDEGFLAALDAATPESIQAAIAQLKQQPDPPLGKIKRLEERLEATAKKPGASVQGFEFVVKQADLAAVLPMMSKLANSPYHAILANVLIEVRQADVVLTTFNLSTAIRVCLPATVTKPGSFTAPAFLLSDLVTRLPDETLALRYIPDEQTLLVESSVGDHRMNGLEADTKLKNSCDR